MGLISQTTQIHPNVILSVIIIIMSITLAGAISVLVKNNNDLREELKSLRDKHSLLQLEAAVLECKAIEYIKTITVLKEQFDAEDIVVFTPDDDDGSLLN